MIVMMKVVVAKMRYFHLNHFNDSGRWHHTQEAL